MGGARILGRRELVHGALLGGAGLLAAALVGCDGGDEDGDDGGVAANIGTASSTAATSPTASPFAGSYSLHDAEFGTEVDVAVEGGTRTIASNGLPNHGTGAFPNPRNPNSISAQQIRYVLPTEPQLAAAVTPYNVPQPFGIATNGVMIDPFAAEWFANDATSGWQLAALANPLGFDGNNAHVQPSGTYHYHGVPTPLVTTTERPELIGFAADGFPIYGPYGYADADDPASEVRELRSSFRLKSGERPGGPGGAYDGTYVEDYEHVAGAGDLDECNGRAGVTPEHPEGTYHYVATNEWPYLGRCFAGEIAESFRVELPAGAGPRDVGGGGAGPGGGPDLEAAAERLGVTVDRLREALGAPPPDLAGAAQSLGVSEQELRDALGVEGP